MTALAVSSIQNVLELCSKSIMIALMHKGQVFSHLFQLLGMSVGFQTLAVEYL